VCSLDFAFEPPENQKFENLGFRPATPCSRLARSGAVFAGMGIGMPRPKRLEKLGIWEPGAVSRAGAQRAVREIGGSGEVRVEGFQNFSFPESGPSEIFGERQKTLAVTQPPG